MATEINFARYVFVNNHITGGVDTFLRTLFSALADTDSSTGIIVNDNYPGLDRLCIAAGPTSSIITYSTMLDNSWFTRVGRKRANSFGGKVVEKLLVLVRRFLEYSLVPVIARQLRCRILISPGVPVLVVNGGFPGSYVSMAAVLAFWRRNPIYVNIHGLAAKRQRGFVTAERIVDKAICSRTTSFIAVSNTCKDSLALRLHGIPHSSRVIFNAISPTAIKGADKEIGFADRPAGPVIGLVATFDPSKGHFFALSILHELCSRGEGTAELRMFGSDPYGFRSVVEAQAQLLGYANRVRTYEYQNSPSTIYSSIDILLVPSKTPESFCLSAIEAVYSGVPVLASNSGALPEILEGLPHCRVLQSWEPTEWANELLLLLSAPQGGESVRGSARLERFCSPHRMADEYCEMVRTS